MKNKFYILLLTLSPILGFSQEAPTNFSLQEAIDYALQNNRQSINAQRDIEAAKA